jgi:hypothetical protein
LEKADLCLREALSSLVGSALTDDQWLTSTLPSRVGGLGLKGTLSTVAGARVSTVVNFLEKGEGIGIRPEFVKVLEDWWERVDDLIKVLGDEVEPLRTWKSDQDVRERSEDFEQQRWWNSKVMNCLAAASDKVGTPR